MKKCVIYSTGLLKRKLTSVDFWSVVMIMYLFLWVYFQSYFDINYYGDEGSIIYKFLQMRDIVMLLFIGCLFVNSDLSIDANGSCDYFLRMNRKMLVTSQVISGFISTLLYFGLSSLFLLGASLVRDNVFPPMGELVCFCILSTVVGFVFSLIIFYCNMMFYHGGIGIAICGILIFLYFALGSYVQVSVWSPIFMVQYVMYMYKANVIGVIGYFSTLIIALLAAIYFGAGRVDLLNKKRKE